MSSFRLPVCLGCRDIAGRTGPPGQNASGASGSPDAGGFAGVDRGLGAVRKAEEEGAVRGDALGDAGEGFAQQGEGDRFTAEGVPLPQTGKEGGKALFPPPVIDGFKRVEDRREEAGAGESLAGLDGEGGGGVAQLLGEFVAGEVDVHPESGHDGGHGVALGLHLAEDPAAFLVAEPEVVRPLDPWSAGWKSRREGLGEGEAGNQGKGGEPCGILDAGTEDQRDVEVLAGGREPDAGKPSPACGLGVGGHNGAIRGLLRGPGEGVMVGRACFGEPSADASEPAGCQGRAEGGFTQNASSPLR